MKREKSKELTSECVVSKLGLLFMEATREELWVNV